MSVIDPRQLNDLASLAARGGLGRGVATTDCVAEEPDQLMFIKGDVLVLLQELPDIVLASCEGVVGWVKKGEVEFDSVASSSSPQASRRSSVEIPTRDDLPRTVLTAPSPPPQIVDLPESGSTHLDAPDQSKRASGPFDFESPAQSPRIELAETSFFDQQQQGHHPEDDDLKRDSITSIASSEALGGIGGFMMGDSESEADHEDGIEELTEDVSPVTAEIATPLSPLLSPATKTFNHSASPKSPGSDGDDWDIYGQYARESMYAPLKNSSKHPTHMPNHRDSTQSIDGLGAVNAARAALEGANSPLGAIAEGSKRPDPLDLDNAKTPKANQTDLIATPLEGGFEGRSIATELRLRIQKEREREVLPTPDVSSSSVTPDATGEEEGDDKEVTFQAPYRPARSPHRRPSVDDNENAEPSVHSERDSEIGLGLESDESMSTLNIVTPISTDQVEVNDKDLPSLMASPMPLDDTPKVAEPLEIPSPIMEYPSPNPDRSHSPALFSPHFAPPKPPGWSSPGLNAPQPVWSPASPASPHSIAATRQAVEVAKATPEGRRPRGLTLVGRMEADLSASKGPVPITFLVGGPDTPGMAQTPPAQSSSTLPSIGLGFPSSGRKSPVTPETRSRSPLSPALPPVPPMPDGIQGIRQSPSRFPAPVRRVTTPVQSPVEERDSSAGPRPGFLAARPRSRSFSATISKAMTRLDNPLSIVTAPPVPSISPALNSPALNSPASVSAPKRNMFGWRSTSKDVKDTPPATPDLAAPIAAPYSTLQANNSTPSLNPPSARSSSFSFASKVKTPKKTSRVLPSPVSHRDYEDTINAEGMDFELVQPKKNASVPSSPMAGANTDIDRSTLNGAASNGRVVPETDEWGFLKEKSTIPEIFVSRSVPGDHRATEQKWLGIIATPIPAGGPSKKVRKLVIEHGIPSSLRGKVWAWFMASSMSARVPGLFAELCGHDKPSAADDQIDRDIEALWDDHSIFHGASAPGRADLRSLLRAYSNFAPSGYSTPMCHIAGTLLIHCVAEDAFWLLSGLINTALKEYYLKDAQGLRVDAGVFEGVIRGSEKDLANAFKEAGVKAADFVEIWYKQLFIRCLPWPTTLRVIDAVVSEGSRFLFVAGLTILTLSRERILALPRTKEAILGYLLDLPQDSLLLPENFMRACEKVRFREEDYKKLRTAVEKEMGVI